MKSKFEADKIDWKIIEQLQSDARMTNTNVGKTVGLSQPAITARINPRALGQEITAIIRLKTTHEKIAHCLKAFDRIPEILEAHRITGDDCFIVKATFAQMPMLEAAIDVLAQFGSVTTSLVLASYKPKPLSAPAAR